MRIVGGRFRGRALQAPKSQAIRPTADRLREALFNILVHAYGNPVATAASNPRRTSEATVHAARPGDAPSVSAVS